ncbi:MAG: 50S ribosomal protein L32 [Deltaproteobacteria bacterium]|nr:50S ribosomal protein L32 [Deltaproteobacteria bacterium]MCX7952628.1 50S ribosomal protein L32 [Deltaproteobacteria bacterium]
MAIVPVPKKRTSKSKRNSRRAHHHIDLQPANVCPQCGSFVLAHTVCNKCGYYKDKRVFV